MNRARTSSYKNLSVSTTEFSYVVPIKQRKIQLHQWNRFYRARLERNLYVSFALKSYMAPYLL